MGSREEVAVTWITLAEIRNPESGIRNLESGIRNPGFGKPPIHPRHQGPPARRLSAIVIAMGRASRLT
jgi:hypothetical protein